MALVDEFVHYAGGSENFPLFPPVNTDAAIQSLKFFFRLEEVRWRAMSELSQEMKLLDRSIVTLAAFEYAAAPFSGISILDEAEAMMDAHRMWLPDLIVLLRVTEKTITRRSQTCTEIRGKLFVNEEFNRRFMEYLLRAPYRFGVKAKIVDAELEIHNVAEALYQILGI